MGSESLIFKPTAEGRTTTWEYDALSRVAARVLPLGQKQIKGVRDT